jgi:PIN domain nuclease of toxin-antitoxin system
MPSPSICCRRIHKDPFDRILLAQANVEGIALTADPIVARYPGPVRQV